MKIEIGQEEQDRLDTFAGQSNAPFNVRCATSEELAVAFTATALETVRAEFNELLAGDPALTRAMTRRLAVLQARPVQVGRMLS